MIVGWTGHRPDVFQRPELAQREVGRAADALLEGTPELEFVSGGQRGVDLWAADAARARGIPFHLVLPVPPRSLTRHWAPEERQALDDGVSHAASVAIIDADETEGPLAYDRRNEAIVRRSDRIVAVWTGVRQGGTFYTLSAARARGVAVEERRLAPAAMIRTAGRGL